MNLSSMSMPDVIGVFCGFILTLMTFSYVFGDNLLFRLALYLFIGVASGYAAVVTWYNVLWPQLVYPLMYGSQNDRLMVAVPLGLSGLLLLKISPRLARLGNPAMAYLLGVGMAAAIGGALMGPLMPQSLSSANLFDLQSFQPGDGFLWQITKNGTILVGTLTTLIYFHFGARQGQRGGLPHRPKWLEALAGIGQIFIAITFGAFFAGVYAAAMTALVERLKFLVDFILALLAIKP